MTSNIFLKKKLKCLKIFSKNFNLDIVEKSVYLARTGKILSGLNKFEKVNIKKKVLNFSINHEKNSKNYLNRAENPRSLFTKLYKKIKVVKTGPGILNGFCTVYIAIPDVFPQFRPFPVPIETPNFKLSKF